MSSQENHQEPAIKADTPCTNKYAWEQSRGQTMLATHNGFEEYRLRGYEAEIPPQGHNAQKATNTTEQIQQEKQATDQQAQIADTTKLLRKQAGKTASARYRTNSRTPRTENDPNTNNNHLARVRRDPTKSRPDNTFGHRGSLGRTPGIKLHRLLHRRTAHNRIRNPAAKTDPGIDVFSKPL